MPFFITTKSLAHILNNLKLSYTFDVRAVSLMRIAVSIVLLIDLFIRSLSIKAFFTEDGILPLEILKNYNWHPYYFSFHAISGELWWQILLFIINAICIIALLIGFRTKLLTFICWTFLVSLQNRNPFILQGGDDLLRLILFWGLFLPWGERYSISKTSSTPNNYFSLANVGYALLVCSVYFFSALLKTSPEWHSEGTAIYYSLSLDQIRLPFGTFLYRFPWLMSVLTHIVYYIELLAPLLILLPFLPSRIRLIGIISIALLHVGISMTLYVGLFYAIGLTTLIGLIPTKNMDWIERKFWKNNTTFVQTEVPESNPSFILEVIYTTKNWLIGLVIAYCLMLNLGNVKWFPFILDTKIVALGKALRLEQNWGMFSPMILKDDGWFVYSGFTKDNTYIDIKHDGSALKFEKPKPVVGEYESDRWRKYGENYVFNNNNYIRPYYCKYLINKWNKDHPDKHITDLAIFFMKEVTLPNYQTKPVEKLALCNCQDK